MKFLITENKLEQIVFKYLDNQDFVKIERGDSVYFLNHERDGFAQIRYDKYVGTCYIDYDLNQEISSFFSLEKFKAIKLIGQWVKNTLQMKVSYTPLLVPGVKLVVENTLQMKVSNQSKVPSYLLIHEISNHGK